MRLVRLAYIDEGLQADKRFFTLLKKEFTWTEVCCVFAPHQLTPDVTRCRWWMIRVVRSMPERRYRCFV